MKDRALTNIFVFKTPEETVKAFLCFYITVYLSAFSKCFASTFGSLSFELTNVQRV